ncbi:MAG: HAMP domain-containing sensor histidine kinase [Pseudomonadota bacterium]
MIGRWLLRMPLAARAPLLAAALMVVVGLVASQQVLLSLTRFQEARLRELVQVHVDGLSVALGPSVLREDVWEVFDTLDRARAAGQAQRMVLTVVADREGHILAATDPRTAPTGSRVGAFVATAQALDAIEVSASDDRITVLAPLTYQGRDVGEILTALDVSDLASERRWTVFWLVLGNAAATGVLALAGYFAMRRMLRPISTLAERMGSGVGQPELIPETEMPRGNTEVGRLLRTYNTLARAVRDEAEARRRLAERERFVSLGRLASSLAHEINNPLGGLLNAVDTIGRYAERPDVVRQSANLVERGLKHLRDVSAAALEHNRLGVSDARFAPHDLEDLRLLICPELESKRQTLSWTVSADPDRMACLPAAVMRQVVLNLLLNATAAAPHGGRVALTVAETADRLEVSVEDDGPGLTDIARARLQSPDAQRPGAGIGLGVVRDLVAGLGGSIACERCEGRTTIAVAVPAAVPVETEAC